MNTFTKIFIPFALGVCIIGFAGLGFSCGDLTQTDGGTSVGQPIEEIPAPPTPAPAEVDSDRDGLIDAEEAKWGTNPLLVDTDGDGYSDKVEVDTGHDPLVK